MERQLEISKAAEKDIDKSGEWYDKQHPGLSLLFYDELNIFLNKINSNPGSFSAYKANSNTRKCSLKKFPYSIYYKLNPQKISVIAVLHQARSVRFLKKRLK